MSSVGRDYFSEVDRDRPSEVRATAILLSSMCMCVRVRVPCAARESESMGSAMLGTGR